MTFFFVYVSSLLGERKPPGDEYNDFDEDLGRPSLSLSRSGEGGMGVGEVEVLRSARKADGYPLQLLWRLIDWIASGSFLFDDNDVLLEYLDQCSSHVGFSFFRFFFVCPLVLSLRGPNLVYAGSGKGGAVAVPKRFLGFSLHPVPCMLSVWLSSERREGVLLFWRGNREGEGRALGILHSGCMGRTSTLSAGENICLVYWCLLTAEAFCFVSSFLAFSRDMTIDLINPHSL